MYSKNIYGAEIWRIEEDGTRRDLDYVAVEEPLEIRLSWVDSGNRNETSLSITMRTPGNDIELAIGFLVGEGIIKTPDQVLSHESLTTENNEHNSVLISLKEGTKFDLEKLERHFYTTSSCGVCGKASIDAVKVSGPPKLSEDSPIVKVDVMNSLAAKLLEKQDIFEHTGGLHAAALFSSNGELVSMREDIGRHNAVDKLIGSAFMDGKLPLNNSIILVSGRASFELLQKSIMAGIPILAAVGAPSSLAVEIAKRHKMTLIGFLRDGRFNIYCGKHRIN